MITKLEKRAIKIVELQEELETTKEYLREFVWPGDCSPEEHKRFIRKVERFLGYNRPNNDLDDVLQEKESKYE
jgi:hypothetical protein